MTQDWEKEFGMLFGVGDERDGIGGWTPFKVKQIKNFIHTLLEQKEKEVREEIIHSLKIKQDILNANNDIDAWNTYETIIELIKESNL